MHTLATRVYLLRSSRLFFMLFFCACAYSNAASFDCAKKNTPVEKSICANQNLGALDEGMAQSYRKLLEKSAANMKPYFRDWQRTWLAGLAENCMRGQDGDACLADAYTKRIDLLDSYRALLDPADKKHADGAQFIVKNASKNYDFSVRLIGECDTESNENSGTCENPGIISVFHKGDKVPLQIIPMENIFITLMEDGQPLTNSAHMYDYQGAINVGDFNFDGEEDFAIQNGNNGAYSGPSYDVYLKDQTGKSFTFSPALSDLIGSTLGFFTIDQARKHLITFAKSGCCYHVSTEYSMVNNTPVPVKQTIDEAGPMGKGQIYTEVFEHDRWKRIKTENYRVAGYCEDELEKLALENFNPGQASIGEGRKACARVPGNRDMGIFASFYPAVAAVDAQADSDRTNGLNVLIADIGKRSLIAKYQDPRQFSREQPTESVIDTAAYFMSQGQRAFGVRHSFGYFPEAGSFQRLNLFERKDKELRNVLRNLIVHAESKEASIQRTVIIGSHMHHDHKDITIEETAVMKAKNTGGDTPPARKKTYQIEYNGHEYVLPAALIAPLWQPVGLQ